MKRVRFSINRGKATVLVALLAIVVLLAVCAGNFIQTANSTSVAVDWGSGASRPCSAANPNCRLAVDWGSSVTPCLPTDLKCRRSTIAPYWGAPPAPTCPLGNPNCDAGKVAGLPPACLSINKICPTTDVNWGS